MHLVPAPAITDLCGEDYKKLFGLLPSPRSPTNHFQKSHQFLRLVSQEGCRNLHEGETLKRFLQTFISGQIVIAWRKKKPPYKSC